MPKSENAPDHDDRIRELAAILVEDETQKGQQATARAIKHRPMAQVVERFIDDTTPEVMERAVALLEQVRKANPQQQMLAHEELKNLAEAFGEWDKASAALSAVFTMELASRCVHQQQQIEQLLLKLATSTDFSAPPVSDGDEISEEDLRQALETGFRAGVRAGAKEALEPLGDFFSSFGRVMKKATEAADKLEQRQQAANA